MLVSRANHLPSRWKNLQSGTLVKQPCGSSPGSKLSISGRLRGSSEMSCRQQHTTPHHTTRKKRLQVSPMGERSVPGNGTWAGSRVRGGSSETGVRDDEFVDVVKHRTAPSDKGVLALHSHLHKTYVRGVSFRAMPDCECVHACQHLQANGDETTRRI